MQARAVAERQPKVPTQAHPIPELSFIRPIPGFTDLRRFALVRLDAAEAVTAPVEGESPLYELRSLERPDVRFMVAAPGIYFTGYEIVLDDQECEDLGLIDSAEALVLVMLTVGPDAESTTANLLAPVVINARTRAAAQIILTGSDWPVRAPIG